MKSILFIGLLLITHAGLWSQQYTYITHFSGTKTYHGIDVKVSSKGYTDSLYYCGPKTGPYYVGNDYSASCCRTGSYTFSFSTAQETVWLDVSALSQSTSYNEYIKVYINGEHLFLSNNGIVSNCEPQAIIGEDGNLHPCNQCPGSGAERIKIEGPVNTIEVQCVIESGEPQGAVFGIYLGAANETEPVVTTYTLRTDPQTGTVEALILPFTGLTNDDISITDIYHHSLVYRLTSDGNNHTRLQLAGARTGTYELVVKYNSQVITGRIVVE